MDGISEPVVLILGHPIAGNPAQFALERAFASAKLEWRVLSCDVIPERIAEAIVGAEALGFRGLLMDESVVSSRSDGESEDNCYFRGTDPDKGWESENALTAWLQQSIGDYCRSLDRERVGTLLWIGAPDPRFPSGIANEESLSPIAWASAESIDNADVIAVTESIDVSEWPRCNGQTLVIDLAATPNDSALMRGLGYRVFDRGDFQVGILMHCFQRWSGRHPDQDTLTEAIEEYLAV